MTKEELLSKTITYLRFPLTVGVVFIHFNIADGFNISGIEYGMNNPKSYYYLITFLSDVLPRIAVPLFFFISGFLFFYNTEFGFDAYKKKLRSRMRTLLIPYLLWNVIAALWLSIRLLPCLSWLFPTAHNLPLDFSLSAILAIFWNINNSLYPMDIPLWYVRDLIVTVLCVPIIYWFVKRFGKCSVIILGLIWYIVQPLNLGHLCQLITAFFFFSWGAFYSINRLDFVKVFRKFSFAPLFYVPIAILDVLTKGNEYNCYIHMLGILLGVVAIVNITSYLIEKHKVKVNAFLANASFFVFVLHYLFLNELGKVIFKLMHQPESPYFGFFFYFLVPVITIIICLGLYIILNKYFPKMLAMLTGGR